MGTNPFDEAGPVVGTEAKPEEGGDAKTPEVKPAEIKPAEGEGKDPAVGETLATGGDPEAGKENSDDKSGSGDEKAKPGAKVEGGEEPKEISLKPLSDSLLEDGALERIAAEAKAQGLTQEQAQSKLEGENKAVAIFAENQRAELEREAVLWSEEARKDPVIGGEKMKETQINVRAVLTRFDPEGKVSKMLDSTKLGNHSVTLRFLNDIGAAMKPDNLQGAGVGIRKGPVTPGEAFFGDIGKKTN